MVGPPLVHQAPESAGQCCREMYCCAIVDRATAALTTHRVTPLGGPGPRGCPKGGGCPGWKPPSAPPPAGRSSLTPAPSTTACCWAVVEVAAGAGGSEEGREEGRLMVVGPHDTIRATAATIERRSSLSNYLAGISIIVRFPP